MAIVIGKLNNMLRKICDNLLNEKWASVLQNNFPLNAKKISAIEYFDDSIRQFFFAEINYYCDRLLKSLVINTNVSMQLLTDENRDNLLDILFHCVELDIDQTRLILENAIQTRLLFLLNPAKCLLMFLYKKNGKMINERRIDEIIKEFNFISDNNNIIALLTDELLEISSTKENISDIEFSDVANDVVFNSVRKMNIAEMLLPLKSLQDFLRSETIPLELIDIFFNEYDLAGVLGKIREYAADNEKENLKYDEIVEIVNDTLNGTYDEKQSLNTAVPVDMVDYIETIENDVDSLIEDVEILINEDNPADITTEEKDVKLEIKMETEEINDIEEKSNPKDDLQESIKSIEEELEKMRLEGMTPMEIETAYLEMENQFLVNFKTELGIH